MGEPETVIRVENISKRYVISHAVDRSRHPTLRDSITRTAKSFMQLLSGRGKAATDPSREEFWALRDVSFEVKRGDVIGIIGRNGAGKSTLLKILSRITEPSTGRIAIDGRVASLLEVGTGFHAELTGRENLFLNGSILGMSRAEVSRKFDEIVAFAEIEKFIDTPVKRYSSGMYMRLAFAVAAHLEPEILIVDEVLAVGDMSFQKKCMGKMGEVAKGGRTVLFVSHNMPAIRQICSRSILLSKGELKLDASVEQCIELYQTSSAVKGGTGWIRELSEYGQDLRVGSVQVEVTGQQPNLRLELIVGMNSLVRHRPSSIAVDVIAADGTTVGQAIPDVSGFIPGDPGEKKVAVEVELPGLIPGDYTLQVWVGTLGLETLDRVRDCGEFTVQESPTFGRTQQHMVCYGYFVPQSSARVLGIETRDRITTSEVDRTAS